MRRVGKPRWHFLVDEKKDLWTTIRAKAAKLNIVAAVKAMQNLRERPGVEIVIEKATLSQDRS
ncbi:MAG TPA: hypothetical protein VIG47_05535 [Gemmatimonadaceae bacterium]|jgi:hypothetical protein